jgi:hypothetical protein
LAEVPLVTAAARSLASLAANTLAEVFRAAVSAARTLPRLAARGRVSELIAVRAATKVAPLRAIRNEDIVFTPTRSFAPRASAARVADVAPRAGVEIGAVTACCAERRATLARVVEPVSRSGTGVATVVARASLKKVVVSLHRTPHAALELCSTLQPASRALTDHSVLTLQALKIVSRESSARRPARESSRAHIAAAESTRPDVTAAESSRAHIAAAESPGPDAAAAKTPDASASTNPAARSATSANSTTSAARLSLTTGAGKEDNESGRRNQPRRTVIVHCSPHAHELLV